MQEFLGYVVQEAIEGRGAAIRAKTIGMDVYGYSPQEIADREGVVRVDAGRVRRKLEQYYESAGSKDEIVISLPVGSYAPAFEMRAAAAPQPNGWFSPRRVVAGSVVVLLAVSAVAWMVLQPAETGDDTDPANLTGIYDIAPARVEAINLGEVGRDLIFPAVDPARLESALVVFEAAIASDPSYFGGHAGAAQVHTTIAVTNWASPAARGALDRAAEETARALSLAPDAAWALSAQAWLDFAEGRYDAAVSLSRRASDLAPLDPHVAEFDSLIALYTSDFDRILQRVPLLESSILDGTGFLFRNAYGSAQFHTGDYAGAIASFEQAIDEGGPFGPVSMAYLMAAYHFAGGAAQARTLARQYVQTWPDARVDLLFDRLFVDPAQAEKLAEGMRGAGWSPED